MSPFCVQGFIWRRWERGGTSPPINGTESKTKVTNHDNENKVQDDHDNENKDHCGHDNLKTRTARDVEMLRHMTDFKLMVAQQSGKGPN